MSLFSSLEPKKKKKKKKRKEEKKDSEKKIRIDELKQVTKKMTGLPLK